MIYEALFGTTPFKFNSTQDILYQIYNKKISFESHFAKISSGMEDLIARMLHPDPRKRITINELFRVVIDDINFENSLITRRSLDPLQKIQLLQNKQLPQLKQSLGEKSTLQGFCCDVIYERNKYKFLIDLAKQTGKFRSYNPA